MERSEETLSTRDLAEPGESAPRDDAVADPATDGREQAPVYDQERVSQDDPAGGIAADNEAGMASRSDEIDQGGAVAPAGDRGTARTTGATTADQAGDTTPLLSAEDSSSFQRHWEQVQTRFVDEPRGAVQEADGLVANVMQQLAKGFAQERERLEAQWDRGEDISTEDLRVALQRYRSFFQRLLSA
jgi:hypothetical protein